MMRTLRSVPAAKNEAICIRHWDWSETSQTVSLFTRDLGVIRAIAKGARREKAPFSGGVELVTRGEMVAIIKPPERNPGGLATLTSWDLLETFPAIRTRLSSFHAAMYMVDLVHHAVRDHDPHPGLYDALAQCLRELAGPAADQRAVLVFQWSALEETGYRPVLDRDVRTGHELKPAGTYFFSPSLGGLIGRDDNGGGRAFPDGLEAGEVWRVRSETIEMLRGLAKQGSLAKDDLPRPDTDPEEVVVRSNSLLASYFRFVLGTWPPSVLGVLPDHPFL